MENAVKSLDTKKSNKKDDKSREQLLRYEKMKLALKFHNNIKSRAAAELDMDPTNFNRQFNSYQKRFGSSETNL